MTDSQTSNHSQIASSEESEIQEAKAFVETNSESNIQTEKEDHPQAADHYLTGWKLAFCILGINLTNFLAALDMTVTMTIQSAVEQRFEAFGNIGWLSSGYILPVAVLAMVWGRVALICGRRVSIFAAILIFELGSLICALANSMNMLVGGRVIAGVGGAGIQSITFLIINDIVPLHRRAIASTFMTLAFVIASVVGPVIGGAFSNSKSLTWRWAFYINLPVGGAALVAMALGYRQKASTEWDLFKAGNLRYKLFTADIPGVLMLSVGLTLLLLGLSFGGDQFAWNSGAVISCFVLGGVILIFYLYFEFVLFDKITERIPNVKKKMYPLICLDVVKNVKVMIGMSALVLECTSFYMVGIYATTYFEIILEYNTLKSSLHLLPMSIAGTLMSFFGGVVMSKLGYIKPLIVIGGLASPIGAGLLLLLDLDSSTGRQIGCMIPCGIAYGAVLVPTLISSQILIKGSAPELLNITTTFFTFMRSIGSSIGSNLATAIFVAAANAKKSKVASLSEYNINTLMAAKEQGITLTAEQHLQVQYVFLDSIRIVFYTALAFGALVLILSLFTTNKRSEVRSKKAGAAVAKPADEESK